MLSRALTILLALSVALANLFCACAHASRATQDLGRGGCASCHSIPAERDLPEPHPETEHCSHCTGAFAVQQAAQKLVLDPSPDLQGLPRWEIGFEPLSPLSPARVAAGAAGPSPPDRTLVALHCCLIV